MKDIFKQIATNNGWTFRYAREDYENLYNGVDNNGVVMLLRPLQFNENFNEYGNVETINWSGSFTLSMSSNFDEISYEQRYENYIRPITTTAYEKFKQEMKCTADFSITSINAVEIINSGDFNLDGLFINFQIEQQINE